MLNSYRIFERETIYRKHELFFGKFSQSTEHLDKSFMVVRLLAIYYLKYFYSNNACNEHVCIGLRSTFAQ